MADHDHSYKLLFSHAEMVADLLRGFVHEDWVQELDFSTLERVNQSHVSDDLRERENDIIWRVQWRGRWLFIYLLIEFQSKIDWWMAVRLMTYIGLLYQDLIKSGEIARPEKLPPVLPIVLYNGDQRWNAPLGLAELMEPLPKRLQRYSPRLDYVLLDEGAYTEAELAPLKNLVALVFRLENSRTPYDILQVVDRLIEWLSAQEQDSLRRAFTVWIGRVILARDKNQPEAVAFKVAELNEVRRMLAERMKEWDRTWHEEGFREGMQQGMQQYVLEALAIRHGFVPEQAKDLIHRINDIEHLRYLHREAIRSPSVDDFMQVLVAGFSG